MVNNVFNEALSGASVDGEGAEDVACDDDDDAPVSRALNEDNDDNPASADDGEVANDVGSIPMLPAGASMKEQWTSKHTVLF